MRGDRLLAVLLAISLFILSFAACIAWYTPDDAGRSYTVPLHVHDKFLLTPEQQRECVRDGSVTVEIPMMGEYTFYNTEQMRPYLNEGGIF